MKKLHTGLIIFDIIDIICISFLTGFSIAYLIKRYRKYKRKNGEDGIVGELREKSPIIMFSKNGKPLKLLNIRGGEKIKVLFSLTIKNKKLLILIKAIIRRRQHLKYLQIFFFSLNSLLTSNVSLRFALGGSLDYIRLILIAFPATLSGFLMGMTVANPLRSLLVPLAILYSRDIENIPNPYENCQLLCKVIEEYHNKQLVIEMKNFFENASDTLHLTVDKPHLLCVEEKLSLIQRYRLKELIKIKKTQKRVQHFNEFIKKFLDCGLDSKDVYDVYEKMAKKMAE